MSNQRTHKKRSGFTLAELLVAIGLTSVVAVGMYSLSQVAAQTFNQQQRVSEMQLRLRSAVEEMRADISRAGYMSTPNSATDPMVCPRPTGVIQALRVTTPLGTLASGGAYANPTVLPLVNTNINPWALTIAGNFVSTDEYRVMGITLGGTKIELQNSTPTYRDRLDTPAAFNRVFAVGRMIRVMGTNGRMQFTIVRTTTPVATGATNFPAMTVNPAIALVGGGVGAGGAIVGCGIPGFGVGAGVAPVTAVEYRIGTAAATMLQAYAGGSANTTGKTDLIRTHMDMNNTLTGWTLGNIPRQRIVAEYAVDLGVGLVWDQIGAGNQPNLIRSALGSAQVSQVLGQAGAAGARPENARALVVRLSVRERIQDPDFPFLPRAAATDPLTRFRLTPTGGGSQTGASRVRSSTFEIALNNLATRNLRN